MSDRIARVHHIGRHHKPAQDSDVRAGRTLREWTEHFEQVRRDEWGGRFSSAHWFPLTPQGAADRERFTSRYGLDADDDFEYMRVSVGELLERYPHAQTPACGYITIVRLNPHKYPGA